MRFWYQYSWSCWSTAFNYSVIAVKTLGNVEKFATALSLFSIEAFNHSKPTTQSRLRCVKRVRIRSYSGPHFTRIFSHLDWIRRDTPYLSVFSPNPGKWGKNEDQNNSEYGHFLRSVPLSLTPTDGIYTGERHLNTPQLDVETSSR